MCFLFVCKIEVATYLAELREIDKRKWSCQGHRDEVSSKQILFANLIFMILC